VATSYELNHIEILDEDRNELAHWRDADLLLRMAAPHLLAALKGALFALDKNQEGSGPSKAKAIKQLARQSPSLNRASHERSEIHRDRGSRVRSRLSAGGGSQLRTRLGSQIREPRPKWVDSTGIGNDSWCRRAAFPGQNGK